MAAKRSMAHRRVERIVAPARILILACPLGFPGAARAEDLVIVGAGRSAYEILVTADALPTTRLAAQELQLYLHRATDVTLPIVHGATPGRSQIVIEQADALPPHAFATTAKAGTIRIAGRDSAGLDPGVNCVDPVFRGTCNGVYEFLERFVGVRWYWGDELGRMVPRARHLVVPEDVTIRQKPFFEYRALDYGPEGSYLGGWARYNRLGSAYTVHHSHTLQEIVPVAAWAKRGHPEYAAVRGGTRRTERQHVCTGNDEVVALVAESAKSLFRRRPDRTMFAISPPDGDGLCLCEQCTRHDVAGYTVPREDRKRHPVLTDRILHFYNAVAERVGREFPDRLVSGYLYMDYQYPPRRETHVAENVALFLAPNAAMESWNERSWAQTQSLYRFWGGFHERVYAHDIGYLFTWAMGLPAPLGERADEFARLLAESHMRGAYLYIGPTWESFGADAYVWARMLWNPKADAVAVRRAYFTDLYGPAAHPVERYYAEATECLRRMTTPDGAEIAELVRSLSRMKAWARERVAGLVLAYAPALDELDHHLDEAEKAGACDPLVSRRLARLRDTQALTVATIRGLQAVIAFDRSRETDKTALSEAGRCIAQREALIARMGEAYAPSLEKWLRHADRSIESPLRADGYYDRLSKE